MTLPYSSATSGQRAVDDIRRTIQAFGCGKFAPMEDFINGLVTVQFEYRGRLVQVTASAKGYASALLRDKPHTYRMRKSKIKYERDALAQGQIAVWSILRDWLKGQVTAIETGVLSFDAAFLGQIMLPNGQTVMERLVDSDVLPRLEGPQ